MRKVSLCLALFLMLLSGRALAFTPTEDGMYAVFDTSMGEFTCKLYFETTQQTVANFVGLAEGTQDWVDEANGLIQRNHPFYDGVTFHRVIEGFMNQAGSPNGEGTDGPGYNIYDEIVIDDTQFNFSRAGLLAMANTGRANTGGAQFFVTVATPTHLNNKHTVFGEVVDGMAVVDAINEVPTTDEKPDVDVVINSVTILREGAAAQAFDPTLYSMPSLGEPHMLMNIVDDEYFLNLDLQPYYRYAVFSSATLGNWALIGFIPQVYSGELGPQDISVGSNLPSSTAGFWQSVRATYPILPKGNVTIEIKDTTQFPDALLYTITLNDDMTGFFDQPGTTSDYEISYYTWHEFGGNYVTLNIRGPQIRPLQFYFKGNSTGDALLFLEAIQGGPEQFIGDLSYEITPNSVP